MNRRGFFGSLVALAVDPRALPFFEAPKLTGLAAWMPSGEIFFGVDRSVGVPLYDVWRDGDYLGSFDDLSDAFQLAAAQVS
jgi:hypothetical protein